MSELPWWSGSEVTGLRPRSTTAIQGWLEFAGLENDGVEQEQTYILHPMKNFNVYDM